MIFSNLGDFKPASRVYEIADLFVKDSMQKKEEHNHEHSPNSTNEYVLRLFITGASPNSVRALTNIRQICEEHLKGRYKLEIIDVYQQEDIAEREQLVALPLLIKKKPLIHLFNITGAAQILCY